MAGPMKQKLPKGSKSSYGGSKAITDPRFANIQTDPRYRLPSRKHTHFHLDKRFAHMLRGDEFSRKAHVDRYGRKLPTDPGKKRLRKFYRLDEEEEDAEPYARHGHEKRDGEGRGSETKESESGDDDEQVQQELRRVDREYDPAREGGFEESSSSEESDESSDEEEQDLYDGLELEAGAEGGVFGRREEAEIPMGEVSSRIAVVNLDWDNIRAVDLMAVAQSFLPPSGRIAKVTVYPSEFGRERMEREDLEGPPPELFANQKAQEKEPRNVPQPLTEHDQDALSSSSSSEDAAPSDDEEALKIALIKQSTDPSQNTEVDHRALRSYQLSRLRYFYAVLAFDSPSTAHHLYTEMDGREYLSSSNFFDLRFVPEEVDFDDEKPRDQCERVPEGYRPAEFVTEALTHSRVRLTWDEEDDAGRKEAQKRAFGGGGDVANEDLRAFVAGESSSEEGEKESGKEAPNGNTDSASVSKAEAQRQRTRALLGLSASPAKSGPKGSKERGPVGDMQITFCSGLAPTRANDGNADAHSSVFANTSPEETTRERYIRKEKERKARRRLKAKAARGDADAIAESRKQEVNVNTEGGLDGEDGSTTHDNGGGRAGKEEDPFEDPFFADPDSANATARRRDKHDKRRRSDAEAAVDEQRRRKEREELALLMADEGGAGDKQEEALSGATRSGHFDMTEIRRREKGGGRSGRKKNRKEIEERVGTGGDGEGGDEINVQDPRFASVFEKHEYAIDPTNPRFTGTKGMKKMLEEGRKRRQVEVGKKSENSREAAGRDNGKRGGEKKRRGDTHTEDRNDLNDLVEKFKRRKVAL